MNTGWLSPTGEFIKSNEYEHYKIASELVEQFQYQYDFNKHQDSTLLKFGWVQLSISRPDNKYRIYFDNHLTEYQKNWIKNKLETEDDFIVDEFNLMLFTEECK
jgi:hypothetical protein